MKIYRDLLSELKKRQRSEGFSSQPMGWLCVLQDFLCGHLWEVFLKLISNEVYYSQGRTYDKLRNEKQEKVVESE